MEKLCGEVNRYCSDRCFEGKEFQGTPDWDIEVHYPPQVVMETPEEKYECCQCHEKFRNVYTIQGSLFCSFACAWGDDVTLEDHTEELLSLIHI